MWKCEKSLKKKGLFLEAQILTTSHFVVWVIRNPPFKIPRSATDTASFKTTLVKGQRKIWVVLKA